MDNGTNYLTLPVQNRRPKPPRPRSITTFPRTNRPRWTPARIKPKTPIKTYRWEEVRRAKARGGYPWTYLTLWRNFRDHEYETVMPPPPSVRITSPAYDRYEPELGTAPRKDSNSSTESRERKERKFLRIPLDDDVAGLPKDGEGSEDEALGVEEKEPDRAIPSPGTTTGSRTDLELNTSQVDSSALEDLPLSRSARRQQRLEQRAEGPGAAARSLQRIRSQAGKLRTKLRNIKRPNINMPERPRFSLPERPKFNLPERPKFNFPDRPKFNLPERPKFTRPKFNLPERPKFNLPERPKFNFPSFSLPRTRRPLRERQQQDDGSSSLDVPDVEQNVHLDTPAPVTTTAKRNYFDFRTYPRIFDRKSRQSAPTRSRPRPVTPPVMQYEDDDMEDDEEPEVTKPTLPPRRRSSGGQQRWVGRFTELEYADADVARTNGSVAPFDDEDEDEEMRALERELHAGDTEEEKSESLSGFRDKDFGYAITLAQHRTLQQQAAPVRMVDDEEDVSLQESEHDVAHSSGSSSDRRRAGVLEEIDSDEFFLREKGLSQEDVGRYLTSEIREAFRPSSDTNALLLENATLNEAELARSYRGTPERSTSNKARPPRRSKKPRMSPPVQRSSPPVTRVSPPVQRISPHRMRASPPLPPVRSQAEEEGETQQYFNTFPPNKPTRDRRRKLRQQRKEFLASTLDHPVKPTAPKRKKRTQSEFVLDNTSQWSEDLNPEWLKTVESQVVTNEIGAGVMVAMMRTDPIEHEYIIPAAPAAPKRGRRQARMQQQQLQQEEEDVEPGYASVVKTVEITIVDKENRPPCAPPPPRRTKTLPRPPFPSIRRRRNRPLSGSGAPHFFTVPHRRGPPTRPVRNYATLGPSRPPRRQRRASLEDVNDATRKLQSGDVIKKMKERPLPPPPRPPRRERGADEGDATFDDIAIETAEVADDARYDDIPENIVQHTIKLSASSEIIHIQQEIPSAPQSPEIPELPEPAETTIFQTDHSAQITSEPIVEPEPTSREPEASPEPTIPLETLKDPEIKTEIPQPEFLPDPPKEFTEEVILRQEPETSQEPTKVEELQVHTHEVEQERTDSELAGDMQSQDTAEMFEPVEEISVSCQTDPLPEDELIRLEMEQEEAMCCPSMCEPESPPPSLQQPRSDMSATTAAILQALNSGQLRLEILDVARLNVNELQAQKLSVSDIEGTSMNVSELQSQGGALVLSSLDAPMSSLAEALISAAQRMVPPPPPPTPPAPPAREPTPSTSTASQCDPAPQPVIERSTVSLQTGASIDDTQYEPSTEADPPSWSEPAVTSHSASSQPQPSTSHAMTSYQSLSPVFTTEQVVALQAATLSNAAREPSQPPSAPRQSSVADVWHPAQQYQEPSIVELGTRLARACYTATLGALRRIVTYSEHLAENSEDSRERGGLQVALCIVLVLVAGIILIGIGGSGGEVHHHHWDFYMPK